jgi:hypothetical protein
MPSVPGFLIAWSIFLCKPFNHVIGEILNFMISYIYRLLKCRCLFKTYKTSILFYNSLKDFIRTLLLHLQDFDLKSL